ncbi:Fc.00g071930.m01.CDS01 [Cosmosporella sp. VM-42]
MDRLQSALPFLEAIETLKGLRRIGWCRQGVPDPESVSDHMYRMTFVCLAHPELHGDDELKAVMMCLVHDVGEVTAGDITPSDGVDPERKFLEERLGLKYLSCLLKQSNPTWAEKLPETWLEYENNESQVSELVHQIDKFECLHQALIYRKRYRGKQDLDQFKGLRKKITDPWLVTQADRIMEEWDDVDELESSTTSIIFVIGGPGVGKGTQCAKIRRDFDFEHISVGDLLREEQNTPGSVFGDFIKESIENSVIVPPSLTMMLLKSKIQAIQEQGKGVLIDGFPRSVGQATAFEQEISDAYSTVFLDCSPEAMVQRVQVRAESSTRADDNAAALEKRLKVFNSSNQEVVNYLKKHLFCKVDASGTDTEVYELVKGVVEEILKQ